MNETQSAGEGSYIEAGTWITYDRQQTVESGDGKFGNPNLKKLGVEENTCAKDLGRTLISTVDTDSVKSKNQDKKGVS